MALPPDGSRRLGAALFCAFGLMALHAGRLGVLSADEVLQKPFRDERTGQKIAPPKQKSGPTGPRGRLADRFGQILAADPANPKEPRLYPCGAACFPVIGHAHKIFGKRHLEAKLDPILSTGGEAPDALLSLDAEAQALAFDLFLGQKGAAVALDVNTGAIRVLVSSPSFDPNTVETVAWEEAARAKEKPFLNRAISELYPPGSTFKIVLAAAALSFGVQPEAISCTGLTGPLRVGDHRAHGYVDLGQAIVESCNQFFGDLGVKLGPPLKEYAARFGFTDEIDLTWPLVLPGYFAEPSLAFARYRYESVVDPDTGVPQRQRVKEEITSFEADKFIVAQGSIGQNSTAATPLQMAMVAQAIASGGVVYRPYLVEEVRRGDTLLFSTKPEAYQRVLESEQAAWIRDRMVEVITRGTGRKIPAVTLPGGARLSIAGKTGTAETVADDAAPHSWFIGFAPAEDPKIAVAVIVENAGLGAEVAGPIAAKMLEFLVPRE